MNADLSLYFFLLGTSPLTVVPTTGHGKELMEKEQGRKGEEEGQFESISNLEYQFSFPSGNVKMGVGGDGEIVLIIIK